MRPTETDDEITLALARVGWDRPGPEIERESFRRIEAECREVRESLSPDCWRVARRLIHTTADTGIAASLSFRNDPAEAGVRALLAGAPVFCDSNMIRAGLSLAKLALCHPVYGPERVRCHIADPDVAVRAREAGRTRALCALEKAMAHHELDGAIVLVGNAPLALAGLARAILLHGLEPALVVGMPVGFVNVLEAKALLALCPVPQIVLEGRRGGSPLAVACLHALIEAALARRSGA